MTNLNAIEKQLNTNQRVFLQNETGRPSYQIELPVDKQWLITHAQEWIDAGKSMDLYKYMGTNAGFEFLLAAWQKEDVIRSKSRKSDVSPEEPDLFSARQAGGPKSPRYQDESQHAQKKRADLEEAPQGARGRTERMMSQMRARQPQATSDLEALAYELQDAEQRDAQEIDKLEREVSDLETDIKGELQKRIATLTKRKGGIRQAAGADTKIDDTLDQLSRINDQQQKEINNLTKAVAGMAQTPGAAPTIQIGATPKPEPTSGQKIEVPATSRSKRVEPVRAATAPIDTFQRGIVEPLATMAPPSAVPAPSGAQSTAAPTVAAADTDEKDFRKRFQVSADQADLFKQAAESLGEAENQDAIDRLKGTKVGRVIAPMAKQAAQAVSQTKLGQKIGQEVGMARSAAGTFARALRGKSGPNPFDAAISPTPQTSVAPVAATPSVATAAPAVTPSAGGIIVPDTYRTRSRSQQTAMQDVIKQAAVTTLPTGWKTGDPIRIGKQAIGPRDPNYAKIVAAMTKQPVQEKKKPQPTNPDLWSRAKSAARSKFDVYPSAYANAWAAKWYKSKGGGWRMGKPKKK